jgi:hypothetical protein
MPRTTPVNAMIASGQIIPARAGAVIHESATCTNCPCPLSKSFGKWVHHWIYANACRTPTAVPGSETRTSG